MGRGGRKQIRLADGELTIAIDLYAQGKTLSEVAERMGYSTSVVSREFRAAGIRLRNRGKKL